MEKGSSTNLTEVARSVQLLKIDGFPLTSTMTVSDCVKSRWYVDAILPGASNMVTLR
jgi:hypothetical protein